MPPTVAELEKRMDRQDERLDGIESSQNGMNEKMIRLDEKMNSNNNETKRVVDKLTEVAADVKTLMLKPAKAYDSLSKSVILLIIGLVVGFVFNHFIAN